MHRLEGNSDPPTLAKEADLTLEGEAETGKSEAPEGVTPSPEECWELLERIAASVHLRRATRLQEILLYIGKRSLEDRCDRLHEHEIGSSVFHRPDSYDTSFDNIVRTSVSDLRRRIAAYFNAEGSDEAMVMEIPRGSYIPVFRPRTPRTRAAAEVANRIHDAAPEAPVSKPKALPNLDHAQWLPVAASIAVLAVVSLAVTSVYFWSRYRSLSNSVYAWQQQPSVTAFWSKIVNSNPDTDVVISDTGIGLVETISQKRFSLNDYLTHSYVSQLDGSDLSPEMHAALNRILAWNLANPDEFTLARRILVFDPPGRKIHLYNARNYIPDLIKRDNVVLIGARKSNPWDELFDERLNFITEFDRPRVINRAPAQGEQPFYSNSESVSFCVVAHMPKPDQSGIVLLIEGTNAEATEAAGDFLLSEDQLSNFKKMLHAREVPYFEVLLKVSSVRGTPLTATIEAYRTYPGKR